jgi:hypothetical protein
MITGRIYDAGIEVDCTVRHNYSNREDYAAKPARKNDIFDVRYVRPQRPIYDEQDRGIRRTREAV